jgi:hypothetical protein
MPDVTPKTGKPDYDSENLLYQLKQAKQIK